MVLLDIDEYIWPEYTPTPEAEGSSSASSTPTKTNTKNDDDHGNRRRDDDEERSSLYESPRDRLASFTTTTIVPSHVPRFSRRAKVCAATWLVVVLLALVVGLSVPGSRVVDSATAAAGSGSPSSSAFNNNGQSTSSQNNSPSDPQSPAASTSSSPDQEGSGASDPTHNTTQHVLDDPCPLELAAVRACFVDDKNGDLDITTSSATYLSASVAQSVCEACLVQSWPSLNASSTLVSASEVCGLDDNATCHELLQCECGSCFGIVAAYLLCVTPCQPSDDLAAWTSIPSSCQQLLEVDPSQSSLDLLPPEISLGDEGGGNGSASATLEPSVAPVSDASSLPPTPVPRCLNESKAFDDCVDPVEGDSASCLLCLLSYWPSTPVEATTTTTDSYDSPYPACDAVLVNATCVGLAQCATTHCNDNGCHDEYVGFLTCQVETCHGGSMADTFECP
jgi:hypothetical protein